MPTPQLLLVLHVHDPWKRHFSSKYYSSETGTETLHHKVQSWLAGCRKSNRGQTYTLHHKAQKRRAQYFLGKCCR
jgi:hypothetical protein